MNKKFKSFLDSVWFNAIMSVVSVGVLIEKVVSNYLSGNYYQEFILIIIWIVLVYHFIKTTKDSISKKRISKTI